MLGLTSLTVRWDMNGDWIFSVSDVGLLLKWLACLPGNVALELLAKSRWVASFFEIGMNPSTGYESMYGAAAWTLSVLAWLVIFGVVTSVSDDLRKNGLVPR